MTEIEQKPKFRYPVAEFLGSTVVSFPACHAGDRGSIPRRGDFCFLTYLINTFLSVRILVSYGPQIGKNKDGIKKTKILIRQGRIRITKNTTGNNLSNVCFCFHSNEYKVTMITLAANEREPLRLCLRKGHVSLLTVSSLAWI